LFVDISHKAVRSYFTPLGRRKKKERNGDRDAGTTAILPPRRIEMKKTKKKKPSIELEQVGPSKKKRKKRNVGCLTTRDNGYGETLETGSSRCGRRETPPQRAGGREGTVHWLRP